MHQENRKKEEEVKERLQSTEVVTVGGGLPGCLREHLPSLRRRLDYFPIKEQTICPRPVRTRGCVQFVAPFLLPNWCPPFLQLGWEINRTMAPSLCRHGLEGRPG